MRLAIRERTFRPQILLRLLPIGAHLQLPVNPRSFERAPNQRTSFGSSSTSKITPVPSMSQTYAIHSISSTAPKYLNLPKQSHRSHSSHKSHPSNFIAFLPLGNLLLTFKALFVCFQCCAKAAVRITGSSFPTADEHRLALYLDD
jgi:hypothetical protein